MEIPFFGSPARMKGLMARATPETQAILHRRRDEHERIAGGRWRKVESTKEAREKLRASGIAGQVQILPAAGKREESSVLRFSSTGFRKNVRWRKLAGRFLEGKRL